MITVQDAINRAYNLLGVSIIAISGAAFFSDLPAEIDQLPHIVDEVLLGVLAIVAVVWYFMGRNKYSHTIVPIVFAVLALAIKVLGTVLEIRDAADVGDEFGALVLFVVTIGLLIWQYVVSARLAAQAQQDVQTQVQQNVHA